METGLLMAAPVFVILYVIVCGCSSFCGTLQRWDSRYSLLFSSLLQYKIPQKLLLQATKLL